MTDPTGHHANFVGASPSDSAHPSGSASRATRGAGRFFPEKSERKSRSSKSPSRHRVAPSGRAGWADSRKKVFPRLYVRQTDPKEYRASFRYRPFQLTIAFD